uniref:Peptidase S9 prolyl oligopeptidase active site domain protein n=1 Tax=Thiomonas intermedia (strain K12) TaxID=75379 RepID=D5X2K9_THIK1
MQTQQTPQNLETPTVPPDGDTAEFESLSVPDRATAEALGADFEDDTPTEADHG